MIKIMSVLRLSLLSYSRLSRTVSLIAAFLLEDTKLSLIHSLRLFSSWIESKCRLSLWMKSEMCRFVLKVSTVFSKRKAALIFFDKIVSSFFKHPSRYYLVFSLVNNIA